MSTLMAMSIPSPRISYASPRWMPNWAVPDVPVPESNTHDLAIEYLRSVLLAWVNEKQRNVLIARNLGIRWIEDEPRCGFDPDLCLIEPPPPAQQLSSLRTWLPDHPIPMLAIEVVSPGHPYKDYVDTPERCAACGIPELWVYAPLMQGPHHAGGPHLLQVWTTQDGVLQRSHAGNAPAYSEVLGAWLHPFAAATQTVANAPAATLKISSAQVGGSYWPTVAEFERNRAEQERSARLALEKRLAELE